MIGQLPEWLIPLILPLAIWDLAWRGLAMWRAGRGNQPRWFIALLVVNSVGILPIIYLLFFKKKPADSEPRAETAS